MNIFDVLGPVMVGPSSSHTAGAVRIGYVTGKLLGEAPRSVEIGLHGSFAATGAGHGTHKALVAGLLGMKPDNMRIPKSFEIAEEAELEIKIVPVDLRDVHPNSVQLNVTGRGGKVLRVVASSLGGGRILIVRLDGIETNFTGSCPTLIVHNLDQPGHVAAVTELLSERKINIAAMQLYRNMPGGYAVMVLECDEMIPHEVLKNLEAKEGIIKVTYLNTEE